MSNVKKWFRGVRGKLLVLGFAPFITMLVVGAIATLGINELGSRLDHMIGVSGKLSRDQAKMDASIHALGRWLWISYGFAENPVERAKFLKKAKEALSSFEEASHGFSALAHDEFDHELVAVVSQEWPLAKAGAEEAIQSLENFQEKDREQVRRLMQTKLPPHLVPLTAAIAKAQLGAKANDLEEAKEVDQNIAMTKLAIALISALTAVTLFGFSIFSAHRLSKALAALAQKVNESGDQVNATAGQMALAADELSAASSEQASAVQETAACIEEISAMVNKSAENAVESERCSSDSKTAAEKGRDIVGRMAISMNSISESNEHLAVAVDESNKKFTEIAKSIKEIDTKTKVINDIVFQTRLLSFNASVEAARAGEHGKGFSVVAEEVGKLAQMSGDAAVEITSLLDESLKKVEAIVRETQSTVGAVMNKSRANVEEGKTVVQECETMLSGIVVSSCDVLQRVSGIALAGKEQSAGVSEISKAIQRIDQSTVIGVDLARQYADGGNLLEARVKDLRIVSSDLFRVIEGHPSVVKFTWGNVYRLGVDKMDDQHKILIEKMNALASEVESALAGTHANVLDAFKDLAGYTQRHFKEEEAYMESIRFSGVSGHREIHRRLLESVMEFGAKIEAGPYDGAALMDFLNNWLMRHILGADMKYAKFSRAKAPASQPHLRSVG